ncbi:16S rRNA (uracil1498-N3)-methyltransferase [Cruoricaptor ignavus]|uniref:Ribosomal RNA small subunit methyltransferase E n=1 Tax=Cruoricaptor ignavus TaxID=1118202 RepID=A0A1M5ZZW2_9FLAO|nr:RsmE family RNA methyltransferase [Cruoricaptor ignavus]SHI29433.1 16S rRNA (uracil1498-N3)-methyltransferase [Cruoricaptor ignavus]
MKLFVGSIFPEIEINSDEQHHISKVLRMKAGEEIHITDGQGNLAKGSLIFEGKKATLQNPEIFQNLPNFSPKLHIAIAPTKSIDRTEFFVEKATELGISEITFLLTEKSERKNLNLERIEKQCIAASKQSLLFHFPKINGLVKLSDFVQNLPPENSFVCHCHENLERLDLLEIPHYQRLTFLIGPEGDFSEKEISLLKSHGIKAVSLGKQRLRTETAGIFIAAWNYENLIGEK